MNRILIIFFMGTLALGTLSCKTGFNPKWTKMQAPDTFKAKFETTKGDFEIEAVREWSPLAVDRLYQLIKTGYYTDIAVFRVVPGFVAQFGISSDTTLTNNWRNNTFEDEPVVESNVKGAISFARGGQRSRTTQIFINLQDNPRLDDLDYGGVKGFPVIARVTSGMEVVESFYGGYGDRSGIDQGRIYTEGNTYLKENFPELDYIHKAYILK